MVIWGEVNYSNDNSIQVSYYGVYARNIAGFSKVATSDTLDDAVFLGSDKSDKPIIFSFKAILAALKKVLAEKGHHHTKSEITDFPISLPPTGHKSTHATGGADALTPADIGAAAAGHSHTAAQVGAAPSNHGHTPESIGAAPSGHRHTKSEITDFPSTMTPTGHKSSHASGGTDALTPADIGAATASHTHTATQVGAAPSNHTHTAAQVGAAPSNHNHTPASIGAAPSNHSHSIYTLAQAAGYTGAEARFVAMLGMLSELGKWPDMPFKVIGTATASNGAVSFPYAIPAFTKVSGTVMIDRQEITIVNQDRFYVPGEDTEAARTVTIDLSAATAKSSMTFSKALSHNYTNHSVLVTLQITITKTGLALKYRVQYTSNYTGELEQYDNTYDVTGDVTYKLAFTCP